MIEFIDLQTQQARITVALPPGHASAAIGKVELYRPSQAALDQHIDLRLDARGEQNIDATALRAGLWKVKVTWAIGGEEFSLDHRIVIGEKPT
jgi:nitrogen fixation protein FixH